MRWWHHVFVLYLCFYCYDKFSVFFIAGAGGGITFWQFLLLEATLQADIRIPAPHDWFFEVWSALQNCEALCTSKFFVCLFGTLTHLLLFLYHHLNLHSISWARTCSLLYSTVPSSWYLSVSLRYYWWHLIRIFLCSAKGNSGYGFLFVETLIYTAIDQVCVWIPIESTWKHIHLNPPVEFFSLLTSKWVLTPPTGIQPSLLVSWVTGSHFAILVLTRDNFGESVHLYWSIGWQFFYKNDLFTESMFIKKLLGPCLQKDLESSEVPVMW